MNDKRPYKGENIQNDISDYTVIDLETTGRNILTCEVIEISAVKVRNSEIVDTFSTLVYPEDMPSEEIIDLTGITLEMLNEAPELELVFEDFIDFIGDDIVLGHNIASFDTNLIYDICEKLNIGTFSNDYLDTYHYSRRCNIDVDDYKLTTLTQYFGIEHENAHRALSDCIANYECYESLKSFYTGNYNNKSTSTSKRNFIYSSETKSLQTLMGIIDGIICDGVLSDEEIYYLEKWTNNNRALVGNYPFDIITEAISNILEDKIITEDEREWFFKILSEFSNPVENHSEKNQDTLSLNNKNIVLTGDFNAGDRCIIKNRLEALGANVKEAVSGKTDYVIVGSKGSENWSYGNYGSKVKKALELQAKGKNIKIIKEEEFFECVITV